MRWNDQRQLLGLMATAFGILTGCGSEFAESQSLDSLPEGCDVQLRLHARRAVVEDSRLVLDRIN
jgi:hypothetical protein